MMNRKFLKRRCPICKTAYGEKLYYISLTLPVRYSICGEYDVVACEECGFIFADVEGTQEKYNEYYKMCNVYSDMHVLKSDTHEEMQEHRVAFLKKYLNKKDYILDIGCGSGELLRILKREGFENVYGMDPSAESIEALRCKKIKGSIGNLFDDVSEEMKGKYDIVCCTAVLEHIYDLNLAIQKLMQYMKPETGKLFLDVPAAEGIESYANKIPHNFHHEHINYFSLQTLDNLFYMKGLSKICSGLSEEKTSMVILGLYGYGGN